MLWCKKRLVESFLKKDTLCCAPTFLEFITHKTRFKDLNPAPYIFY